MKRIIVQLYEIQKPREAERLIELGVDHIGSVILSPEKMKDPEIRDVVRLVRQSPTKSSLIPLLAREDDILRALDYHQPDFVHFCELIPLAEPEKARRETRCAELLRHQRRVRKEFPEMGIIRSIPVPGPGMDNPEPLREAILWIARELAAESAYFMTDTLQGVDGQAQDASQPVAGYVGITGEVCDWELAKALVEAAPIPVILAGGISAENVAEGIRRIRPAGIDSCTQTNARDPRGKPIRFQKDMERVRRLIDEVRRAEEEL
jgi:phosphoribosylanthranilate isomerase